MGAPNAEVDGYFERLTQWRDELLALRAICLDTPLVEAYKWRQPCYTSHGTNVAILGAFKDSCIVAFFKGVLLDDPEGVLEATGPNTQSSRLIRFVSVESVRELEPVVRAYIDEAIRIEREGRTVEYKPTSAYDVPDELQAKLDASPEFRAAFEALTPGRQRGYLLHFGSAKRPATRTARIEKATPRIIEGKGLNDR